jgi:Interferon-inducible GTPase (IIGP)
MNFLFSFDFPNMCQSLLRDYPGLKRQAMILAMSTNCKEVIRAKVDILRGQTWVAAAVSAAVATPPVPGLSVMFDFSLTVGFVLFYKKQLGLDDESLARIAAIHRIPLYVIQDELQKILPAHFFTAVPEFVISLVKKQAVGTATEEVLRYVPYVGSVICATVSFSIILSVLRNLLNVMEKAALALIDIVAERSVSDDEDDDEPI